MSKLDGVNQKLVAVVEQAHKESKVAFRVTEGLRTIDRQKQLLKEGKTKTMNSKHLAGTAVDIVAMIDNHASWSIHLYVEIAKVFAKVSKELETPIRWGGCWTIITPEMDLGKEMDRYVSQCRAAGRKPLVDAVHFELAGI